MAKKNYELYTIDAQSLLNRAKFSHDGNNNNYFYYEFSTTSITDADVIEKTVSQQSNALFDQIRLIADPKYDIYNQEPGSDTFLLDKIVRLDFKRYFSKRNNEHGLNLKNIISSLKNNNGSLTPNINKYNQKDAYNIRSRKTIQKEEETVKLLHLFTYGFYMLVPNKDGKSEQKVHMLPFEKTTSLSREMQMFFISDEFLPYYTNKNKSTDKKADLEESKKKDIVNRIMLDMELKRKDMFNNTPISKFYAYRGLMTSGGKPCRIDGKNDSLLLNEKNFIVINDISGNAGKVSYIAIVDDKDEFTEKTEVDLEKGLKELYKTNEYKINNVYDGQGLCSIEFAEKISKQYDGTNCNKLFQFRMPFCKGVLHALDFKGIIKEYFTHNNDGLSKDEMFEKIYIKDAFGIYRKFSDIEVIVTASQFKFIKFMKDHYCNYTENEDLSADGKINRNKVDCDDKKNTEYNRENDPMAKYIDSLHRYNHAFYVLHTNNYDINETDTNGESVSEDISNEVLLKKAKGNNEFVGFNYQFLINTPILNSDLERIIKPADKIFKIEKVEGAHEADEIKICPNGFLDKSNSKELIRFIKKDPYVRKNARLLSLAKYRENFEYKRQAYLKDIARGRFKVSGSRQFIARDLLNMLVDIIGFSNSDNNEAQKSRGLKYLDKDYNIKNLIDIESNRDNHNELFHHTLSSYNNKNFFSANFAENKKSSNSKAETGNDADSKPKSYINNGKLFAIYRSPQYSRNEIGLLRSYKYAIDNNDKHMMTLKGLNENGETYEDKFDFYQRYCNNFGVTQLPKSSTIADRLGGADFDGDAVNLISDKNIVNSICRYFGLFKNNRNELINGWLTKYEKRNPFINIQTGKPSKDKNENTKTNNNKISEYTEEYNRLMLPATFMSFYNLVGIFSYKVFKIATYDYAEKYDKYNKLITANKKSSNDESEIKDAEQQANNYMEECCSVPAIGAIVNGNLIDYAKTEFMPTKAKNAIEEYIYDRESSVAKASDLDEYNFTLNGAGKPKNYFLYLSSNTGAISKSFNFSDALKSKNKITIQKITKTHADKVWFKPNDNVNEIKYDSLKLSPHNTIFIKEIDKNILPVYNCPGYFYKYLKAAKTSKGDYRVKVTGLQEKSKPSNKKDGKNGIKNFSFEEEKVDLTVKENCDKLNYLTALITAYKVVKKNTEQFDKFLKSDAKKIRISLLRLLNRKFYTNDKSAINNGLKAYMTSQKENVNVTIDMVLNEIINNFVNICEAQGIDTLNNMLSGLTDYCSDKNDYLIKYDSCYLEENGKSKEMSNCWIYAGDCPVEKLKDFLDEKIFNGQEFSDSNIKDIAYNLLCDFRNDGAMILPSIIQYTIKCVDESKAVIVKGIIKASENISFNDEGQLQDAENDSEKISLFAMKNKTLPIFIKRFNCGDNDEFDKKYKDYLSDMNELLSKRIDDRISKSAYNSNIIKYCQMQLMDIFKDDSINTDANGDESVSQKIKADEIYKTSLKYIYKVSCSTSKGKYSIDDKNAKKSTSNKGKLDSDLRFMLDVIPEEIIYDSIIVAKSTEKG